MNLCEHPIHMQVEDVREGFITCIQCSRVIDQIYCFEPNIPYPHEIKNVESSPTTSPEIRYLKDICSNFNIPTYIAHKCVTIYEDAKQRTSGKRRLPKNALVAFAIYRGMLEEGVPRSAQEIYSMTNVPLSQIFEIEGICEIGMDFSSITSSESYIERFATFCDLNFQDIKIIKAKCSLADDICENSAPQNIAAALIFLYDKQLTVQRISKICCVSSSSIYKIVKKLNADLRFSQ